MKLLNKLRNLKYSKTFKYLLLWCIVILFIYFFYINENDIKNLTKNRSKYLPFSRNLFQDFYFNSSNQNEEITKFRILSRKRSKFRPQNQSKIRLYSTNNESKIVRITTKTREVKPKIIQPQKISFKDAECPKTDRWITAQMNGETGNVMCIYAHLKFLQLKFHSQVMYFSIIKHFII